MVDEIVQMEQGQWILIAQRADPNGRYLPCCHACGVGAEIRIDVTERTGLHRYGQSACFCVPCFSGEKDEDPLRGGRWRPWKQMSAEFLAEFKIAVAMIV